MRIVHTTFLSHLFFVTVLSMLTDRATYHPGRLVRSIAALRRNPWLTRELFRELGTYTRRGFHPTDNATAYLLETWRSELSGDQGVLADNLAHGRTRRSG